MALTQASLPFHSLVSCGTCVQEFQGRLGREVGGVAVRKWAKEEPMARRGRAAKPWQPARVLGAVSPKSSMTRKQPTFWRYIPQ